MAEQNKTQMGDGADNYGQAAGQMAKAAKQLGQEAAKQQQMLLLQQFRQVWKAEKPPQRLPPVRRQVALGVRFFLQLGLCVTHCLKF